MRHIRHTRFTVPFLGIVALTAAAVVAPVLTPAAAAPTAPVTPTASAERVATAEPRAIAVQFPKGGPGPAGAPIDTVAVSKAAATYRTCAPGGPTAADVTLATAIRPWLTGSLASASSTSLAESVSCARIIIATVAANGMDRQAAVIALATTVVESGMKNVTYGDRDSLGLYQQRPSQGWGSAAQVQDPVYATNAFLTALKRNFPNDVWQTRQAGVVAQGVQISAFPDRYEPQAADGVQLVSRLWTESSQLLAFAPSSGAIARSGPSTCLTELCVTGNVALDRSRATTSLATGYGTYQLQASTGTLYRSTGVACNGATCAGWTPISRDTKTTQVVGGVGGVYRFQASTGYLYQYTGSPCTASCTGWRLIDKNPATTRVLAGPSGVFQFQASTKQLWRFTGRPCATNGGCSGWQLMSDSTPATAVVLGPTSVVAFDATTGRMSRAFTNCSTADCLQWIHLDTDPTITTIVINGAGLYKFAKTTKALGRWNGAACTVSSCAGWVAFDRNAATVGIVGGATSILQLHGSNGEVWSSTGTACTAAGCGGWVRVAVRPGATAILAT